MPSILGDCHHRSCLHPLSHAVQNPLFLKGNMNWNIQCKSSFHAIKRLHKLHSLNETFLSQAGRAFSTMILIPDESADTHTQKWYTGCKKFFIQWTELLYHHYSYGISLERKVAYSVYSKDEWTKLKSDHCHLKVPCLYIKDALQLCEELKDHTALVHRDKPRCLYQQNEFLPNPRGSASPCHG